MIAVAGFAVYPFVAYRFVAYLFVTAQRGATTHCHHNFGYYCGKSLIPCVVMSGGTGTRYALKSKVVYSR
jgi:hypothetical protein